MSEVKYDAEAIKVLEGLEAVRKRPGMYIGDTAERGFHHLAFEVIDNSVDEALAGACRNIDVVIRSDGSLSVADDGRGIPVGIHKEKGIPAVEVVMTYLHAGGKFDHKVFKISGGLHGVGVSVVNALSRWLEVDVFTEGYHHHQRYERGKPVTKLKRLGPTKRRGTRVTFMPDEEIFGERSFKYDILASRLRELAYLTPGLRITLKDERAETDKEDVFFSKGGLVEFVELLNASRNTLHPKPIFIRGEQNGVQVEVALQYNDGYQENILCYTNNIRNIEGGTHLSGFKSALTRTINAYARASNLNKKGSLSGDDVREGLTAAKFLASGLGTLIVGLIVARLDPKHWKRAGAFWLAVLVAAGCNAGLKVLAGRERPSREGQIPGHERTVFHGPALGLRHASCQSFPSGHTLSGFASATALSAFYPPAAPVFYAVAAATGINRVVKHQHFLSDVVAGAVLGHVLALSRRIPLAKAKPSRAIASSTFCLAVPGSHYVVYLPEGGSVEVNLSAAKGQLAVEWFNPSSGKTTRRGKVAGGARRKFTAPFKGDAVLYLAAT